MAQLEHSMRSEASDAILSTNPSDALTVRTMPVRPDFMVPTPVFPHLGHVRSTDNLDGPAMFDSGRSGTEANVLI